MEAQNEFYLRGELSTSQLAMIDVDVSADTVDALYAVQCVKTCLYRNGCVQVIFYKDNSAGYKGTCVLQMQHQHRCIKQQMYDPDDISIVSTGFTRHFLIFDHYI